MASPVIINSSSPTSLRIPSITPPSRRDSIKNGTASSEGLPSPSIFVQPKAVGLKSGSRAQAVPAQAGFGFATAGKLWRENKFQHDVLQTEFQQGEQESPMPQRKAATKDTRERRDAQESAAGRLKKPKKAARTETKSSTKESGNVTLEFEDFACRDATAQPERSLSKPSPAEPAMNQRKQTAAPRKSSMELSEYAFGVYDLGMQTQAPVAAAVGKKPRKKAAASERPESKGDARSKPRKQKAKSEAVILNSDDAAQDEARVPKDRGMFQDHDASKGKTAKERKSSKPANATGSAKLEASKKSTERRKQSSKTAKEAASETSAYFAVHPATDSRAPEDPEGSRKGHETAVEAQDRAFKDQNSGFTESALPRRTNWTPVKDTEPSHHDAVVCTTGSPSHAGSPKIRLADILGGFGYTEAATAKSSIQRSVTGEAVTKRRRIELADAAVVGPQTRKAEASPETTEPKQSKAAGRKKLQTITALATAAYQPAADPHTEQSTVSEFFAPRKETGDEPKEGAAAGKGPAKPRKSRKKKTAGEQDVETGPAAPNKSKSKRTKVKFNEADHRSKLFTPARASAQMKQQDFLFGTSSQLAVDESASFIRDLQAAVEASELECSRVQPDAYTSQVEASESLQSQVLTTPRKGKSCLKVPTAPHGTCLSVGQAHRDLWCVSSRDEDGGFLREPFKENVTSEVLQPWEQHAETSAVSGKDPDERDEMVNHSTVAEATKEPTMSREASPHLDVDIFGSCGRPKTTDTTTEIPFAAVPVSAAVTADESALTTRTGTRQQGTALPNDHEPVDDNWMLLSSDGPFENGPQNPAPAVNKLQTGSGRGPLAEQASTVERVLPTKSRSVLQPLDANASILSAASPKLPPLQQARALSTNKRDSLPKSPAVKKRGRPPKIASPQAHPRVSPRKRGRPRKESVVASDPSPGVIKFRKPETTPSASQPPISPSEWLHVDEIYDSDSTKTPSPPRRRASSSPPTVPPLDIMVDGPSVLVSKEKTKPAVAVAATLKPGEPQWPSVREQVFPRISSTVKNAPRSTDSERPSWYQKILMYDPIVLEDLTSWLNGQDLRIQVRRQKPKAKKRGRKKRDADGTVMEQDAETEEEVHEEPLQAWMVQKWCEERSICCVWAGGGWGGRTRH